MEVLTCRGEELKKAVRQSNRFCSSTNEKSTIEYAQCRNKQKMRVLTLQVVKCIFDFVSFYCLAFYFFLIINIKEPSSLGKKVNVYKLV